LLQAIANSRKNGFTGKKISPIKTNENQPKNRPEINKFIQQLGLIER
jgi:hypothetical protein